MKVKQECGECALHVRLRNSDPILPSWISVRELQVGRLNPQLEGSGNLSTNMCGYILTQKERRYIFEGVWVKVYKCARVDV